VERLADGKVTIEPLPCDLVCLVEAAIADSREPTRVQAKLAPKLSRDTDGRLLRIVVSNLIDNALKYGKSGEHIEVELLADGTQMRLVVSNPIGIAGAPNPERVFEKYYRAPSAHEFSGSGLGLHISQALARLLGGELGYTQTEGRVIFQLHL
jgi:signal transduction histidine kinase